MQQLPPCGLLTVLKCLFVRCFLFPEARRAQASLPPCQCILERVDPVFSVSHLFQKSHSKSFISSSVNLKEEYFRRPGLLRWALASALPARLPDGWLLSDVSLFSKIHTLQASILPYRFVLHRIVPLSRPLFKVIAFVFPTRAPDA